MYVLSASGSLVSDNTLYPTFNYLYDLGEYHITGSVVEVNLSKCEIDESIPSGNIGIVYERTMGCNSITTRLELLYSLGKYYEVVVVVLTLDHIESFVWAANTPWTKEGHRGMLALSLKPIPASDFAMIESTINPWEGLYKRSNISLNIFNFIHSSIPLFTAIFIFIPNSTKPLLRRGTSLIVFFTSCCSIIEHILYQVYHRGIASEISVPFRFLSAGVALVAYIFTIDRHLSLCSFAFRGRMRQFLHFYLRFMAVYSGIMLTLKIIMSYVAAGSNIVFWMGIPAIGMWIFIVITHTVIVYHMVKQLRKFPSLHLQTVMRKFVYMAVTGMIVGFFVVFGFMVLAGINTNNVVLVETIRQFFQLSLSILMFTIIASFYLESSYKVSFNLSIDESHHIGRISFNFHTSNT